MADPALAWLHAGRRGARFIGFLSGLITLVLATIFGGVGGFRLPFIGLAIVAAVGYAILTWQAMAIRNDGVAMGGALFAGGLAPLVGCFVLDVTLSLYRGSGDGLAGSVLLVYWPVTLLGIAAGICAAFATASFVRRSFNQHNVPDLTG